MKLFNGLFLGLWVAALMVAGSAMAQSPAAVNVLVDNEKVQAYEIRYKPGDENKNVPRAARVARALTGGTLLRTYPDGKTEKVEFKAGEVRFNPAVLGNAPQYTTKNVGNSDLTLYVVVLK